MSEIKYVTPSGLTHYDEKIKEVIGEVDTSTNTKVTQTPTSTDASYPLLLSPSGQTQETNTTSYFNSGVVLNPSTKTISADIDGNSATATKATQDGDGNVISSTYSKTGHTHNYAGSSSAGGAATTAIKDGNGNIITETYASKSIYGDDAINLGRKIDTTVGLNSVAIGTDVTASGKQSVALGHKVTASGSYSYSQGVQTIASGSSSHAHGYHTTASGKHSHAHGSETTASGDYSHAEGRGTTALINQHAQGHYNDTTLATDNNISGVTDGTAFVIGNGTSSTKSNAFRITGRGVAYAKGAYNSTGADYAEFAEWADGNPNNEDRRGYFVTFDEEKPTMIRKANAGEYILGIVSGNPCIIGNADEGWLGKYVFDEFGGIVYEDVEIEETYTDKTGEEKTRTVKVNTYKINPDYDPTKEYVHREKRKEWDAIGWIGVLSVRDDGTCQVNGYCKCTDGGIATACEKGEGYRIIKRVSDNIVKVVLK